MPSVPDPASKCSPNHCATLPTPPSPPRWTKTTTLTTRDLRQLVTQQLIHRHLLPPRLSHLPVLNGLGDRRVQPVLLGPLLSPTPILPPLWMTVMWWLRAVLLHLHPTGRVTMLVRWLFWVCTPITQSSSCPHHSH